MRFLRTEKYSATDGMPKISGQVISIEDYQTVDLRLSNVSVEEARLIIPPIKDSLRRDPFLHTRKSMLVHKTN